MLNVEKDWVENQEYLGNLCSLLKEKNLSVIDSNLVYEVAYAKTYISILKGKESLVNSSFLSDCEFVFDMVLSKVPYQDLPSIPTGEYKNLLKCKFTNVEDAGIPSYMEKPHKSAIEIYIRRKFPLFIVLWVFAIFVVSGSLHNLSNFITDSMNAPSAVSLVIHLVDILAEAGFMLIFLVLSIDMLLSGMYVVFPGIFNKKELNFLDNMVSSEAKEALKESVEGLTVQEEICDFDRIKRNIVWLNSLIEAEKASNGYFFVDSSVLLGLKERLTTVSGKDYYLALAQIEFLHKKFIDFCNKVD